MTVVYLDIVFLENIVINYIILYSTAIIIKCKKSKIKILQGAIIGAIYAIILFVTKLNIYSNIVLKIFLSIVIVYIAFRPNTPKILIKELIIFYLTSFTFGGVALSLLYFVKPQDIFMKNGVFIGTYPIKIALLGGIIGFIIITVSFKAVKSKINRRNIFCNIRIYIKDKFVEIKAIVDTGNLLREPISKLPVIVVEKDKLINLIPKEILDNTETILNNTKETELKDDEQNKYIERLRIIPFKSVGKENGLLLGFKADKVIIKDEEKEEERTAIIGIYNKKFTSNELYSALVGIDLVEENK